MDLLSKAKEFLARKASKLAMAAVPLAVLAIATPAKATTVILDSGGTDPCFAQSNGTCTLSTTPTGGNSFMNQLVLTGTASAFEGFANLSTSGGTTTNGGTLPAGTVPVSWVFSVTGNSGTASWDVFFDLEYATGTYSFSQSGSTSGGMVTGNGSINITSAEAITSYELGVDVDGSGNFTLTAPLNLNYTPSSAPEPASMLLIGAGGGALLLLKKRKKQA